MSRRRDKILELFEHTKTLELSYNGALKDIDHEHLNFKAGESKNLYDILGGTLSLFNHQFNGCDSILMIVSIPVVGKDISKQLSERVMEIYKVFEECFVTLDYSQMVEKKPYMYITVTKKL